jgi:hypothetical protein
MRFGRDEQNLPHHPIGSSRAKPLSGVELKPAFPPPGLPVSPEFPHKKINQSGRVQGVSLSAVNRTG